MAEAEKRNVPHIEDVFSAINKFQYAMHTNLRDKGSVAAGKEMPALQADLRRQFEDWGFVVDWTERNG